MWIRSQDKRILIKVDNVFLNANYDNKRISTYDGDSNTTLGEYKTKERALEVLNMIEDILIARYRMDLCNNASSMFRGYGQEEIKKTIRKITIFEMPEE